MNSIEGEDLSTYEIVTTTGNYGCLVKRIVEEIPHGEGVQCRSSVGLRHTCCLTRKEAFDFVEGHGFTCEEPQIEEMYLLVQKEFDLRFESHLRDDTLLSAWRNVFIRSRPTTC